LSGGLVVVYPRPAVGPDGSATLSPWPLTVPELRRTVVGYEADGYPERLEPLERDFVVSPA
jgi:hypothetical protein